MEITRDISPVSMAIHAPVKVKGAILPFARISIQRYFIDIGFEYLGMAAPIIAIGYLLEVKAKEI